ncbi:C39 family peptidase [Paenibacillus taichungensis]
MRKICLSIFLAVLLMLMPVAAFADSPSDSAIPTSTYHKAIEAAASYVGIVQANTEDWKNTKISYDFPLFDFDGNVTAYLFSVKLEASNSGYLIVSADNNPVVLESAREGDHPYFKANEGQPIYVGATMYYVKLNSSEFIDIREGKTITSNDLKSKGTLSGKASDQFIIPETDSASEISPLTVQPQTIISYSQKLISGVPDFTWYLGCSPTVFSNITKYWDNNGYPNLVQSTTTTNTLIEVMANYMSTNSDGTTGWDNRVTGMKKFWTDRNYSVCVSRVSANFSTHKTEMTNNRPDVINVVGDATYGNHDMTGVGYEEYQDTNQNLAWFRYVIVHDTWSNTPTDVYIYLPQLSWNETVKVVPN